MYLFTARQEYKQFGGGGHILSMHFFRGRTDTFGICEHHEDTERLL